MHSIAQSTNDFNVMDAFLFSRQYCPYRIKQMSYRRMILQVHTIADLSTTGGPAEIIHRRRARALSLKSFRTDQARDCVGIVEAPKQHVVQCP
jgi:hypothetical protein